MINICKVILISKSTEDSISSKCYLTNKIPFLDVYGDINLVGHVIKSHKARRALWKI